MTTADLKLVADLAAASARPQQLALGGFHVVHSTGGQIQTFDLTTDHYRDTPARKTGTTTVRDIGSFITYWAKHHIDGASEIYADRDQTLITAVLDAHTTDTPGWAVHRLQLRLRHSEAWKTWLANNGKQLEQEAFAEHIELNLADIREPEAATMLEIAQTMSGTIKADWQSGITLANGARRLAYVETANATAGAKGDLVIPKEMLLGLPVFEGAMLVDPVRALFRYRISNGKLTLGYVLDRPHDVISAAFEGIVESIATGTIQPVLCGTPAS